MVALPQKDAKMSDENWKILLEHFKDEKTLVAAISAKAEEKACSFPGAAELVLKGISPEEPKEEKTVAVKTEFVSSQRIEHPVAIVPTSSQNLVMPVAPLDDIVVAMDMYQETMDRIGKPADYQKIGDKAFPKKSLVRKLAVAFNLTEQILWIEEEKDGEGRIITAKAMARITAPNGKVVEEIGVCSSYDKKGGRASFSNPEHDIRATAVTRAKNRAILNMVGKGSVSAEEVEG
jgi:hypothetical protein